VELAVRRREFVLGAAALAFAPRAFALSLSHTPTALVTADLESHVVAVDLNTGKVLRRIATAPGPRSIETVGNLAVVGHTERGLLTVIDGATLRVRATIGGFTEPRYTVAARDGEHAYVTDSKTGELAVVAARRGRVVGRVVLGGAPRHLSYEPSAEVVWVVLGNSADRIAVVDVSSPTRPRLVRRISPPLLAHDVGFGPGRVWVTGGASRELVVYDPKGRTVRLQADAPPQHVTFVGNRAYVASGDDGTLQVHDARTGRLLRTSRLPGGSFNVQREARAGGLVVTPSLSRGTLCVVDQSGRVLRQPRIARSSHDACFVVRA
jgi:DNA-binding beta-propeller fold protein YncE